jgi:hypothetical protein
MKAIVLFITAVFIVGLVNLFTPKPIPHTETESANNICAISKDDFDYVLQMKDVGSIYRIGDQREAFIGTYDNGITFDGKNAYQYIDNQETPISEFPFELYDSQAERFLAIAQKIISEGLYTSYADDRKEYADILYYFRITKEGLMLFDDQSYEYGLIACYYQEGDFKTFDMSFTETGGNRQTIWYTFGTIDYKPTVLP